MVIKLHARRLWSIILILIMVSGALGTQPIAFAQDNVKYQFRDDFNSFNSDFWKVIDKYGPAMDMTELSNGILTLKATETDNYPTLISKEIPIEMGDTLIVKRRVYAHPEHDKFSEGTYITEESDNTWNTTRDRSFNFLLFHQHLYFTYDVGRYPENLTKGNFGHARVDGFTALNQLAPENYGITSSTLDQWVEEEFIYDTSTGMVTIKTGSEFMTFQSRALTKPFVRYHMSPWGWYTGQYNQLDWIEFTVVGQSESNTGNNGNATGMGNGAVNGVGSGAVNGVGNSGTNGIGNGSGSGNGAGNGGSNGNGNNASGGIGNGGITIAGTGIIEGGALRGYESDLSGVLVELIQNGVVMKSAQTNSQALYSLTAPYGTYELKISAPGHLSVVYHDVVLNQETMTMDPVELVVDEIGDALRFPDSDTMITDAQTGQYMKDVTVKVREGFNNKTGSVIASFKTDGSYEGFGDTTLDQGLSKQNLTHGYYTLTFEKSGYYPVSVNLPVDYDSWPMLGNIAMAKTVGMNDVRAVLSWGEDPSDLDMYLRYVNADGGLNLINYRNKRYEANGRVLVLDKDDSGGFGPETITLTNPGVNNNNYDIFVYNATAFTDEFTLSRSNAHVSVYASSGIHKYRVPIQTGNVWHVCSIVNGQVVTVNEIIQLDDIYDLLSN